MDAPKVVYLAHPLGHGADRERNRANAARWVGWATRFHGAAVIADWITVAGQTPDTEDARELGLRVDIALVVRCDELWLVGGRISEGMALEAHGARSVGIRVRDMTYLGYEPPFCRCVEDQCTLAPRTLRSLCGWCDRLIEQVAA